MCDCCLFCCPPFSLTSAPFSPSASLRTRERTTEMLRQSVATLSETEEVATEALTELDRQGACVPRSVQRLRPAVPSPPLLSCAGNVIRRTHQKAVEVNDDVKTANWMLRGMKSIGGFFRNSLFSKPPEPSAAPPPRHSGMDTRAAVAAASRGRGASGGGGAGGGGGSGGAGGGRGSRPSATASADARWERSVAGGSRAGAGASRSAKPHPRTSATPALSAMAADEDDALLDALSAKLSK